MDTQPSVSSRLDNLPVEILTPIAANLDSDGFFNLRQTSRTIEAKTFVEFTRRYFSVRAVLFTSESLGTLHKISQHHRLRLLVNTIYIVSAGFADPSNIGPPYLPRPQHEASGRRKLRHEEALIAYSMDQSLLKKLAGNAGGDIHYLAESFKRLPQLAAVIIVDSADDLPDLVSCYGFNKVLRTTYSRYLLSPFHVSDTKKNSHLTHVFRATLLALAQSSISTIRQFEVFSCPGGGLIPHKAFKFEPMIVQTLSKCFARLEKFALRIRTLKHSTRQATELSEKDKATSLLASSHLAPIFQNVRDCHLVGDHGHSAGGICMAVSSRVDLHQITAYYLEGITIKVKRLAMIMCRLRSVRIVTLMRIDLENGSWPPILQVLRKMQNLSHLHLISLMEGGRLVRFKNPAVLSRSIAPRHGSMSSIASGSISDGPISSLHGPEYSALPSNMIMNGDSSGNPSSSLGITESNAFLSCSTDKVAVSDHGAANLKPPAEAQGNVTAADSPLIYRPPDIACPWAESRANMPKKFQNIQHQFADFCLRNHEISERLPRFIAEYSAPSLYDTIMHPPSPPGIPPGMPMPPFMHAPMQPAIPPLWHPPTHGPMHLPVPAAEHTEFNVPSHSTADSPAPHSPIDELTTMEHSQPPTIYHSPPGQLFLDNTQQQLDDTEVFNAETTSLESPQSFVPAVNASAGAPPQSFEAFNTVDGAQASHNDDHGIAPPISGSGLDVSVAGSQAHDSPATSHSEAGPSASAALPNNLSTSMSAAMTAESTPGQDASILSSPYEHYVGALQIVQVFLHYRNGGTDGDLPVHLTSAATEELKAGMSLSSSVLDAVAELSSHLYEKDVYSASSKPGKGAMHHYFGKKIPTTEGESDAQMASSTEKRKAAAHEAYLAALVAKLEKEYRDTGGLLGHDDMVEGEADSNLSDDENLTDNQAEYRPGHA